MKNIFKAFIMAGGLLTLSQSIHPKSSFVENFKKGATQAVFTSLGFLQTKYWLAGLLLIPLTNKLNQLNYYDSTCDFLKEYVGVPSALMIYQPNLFMVHLGFKLLPAIVSKIGTFLNYKSKEVQG